MEVIDILIKLKQKELRAKRVLEYSRIELKFFSKNNESIFLNM
jgi:hypothetical protein